MNEPFAPDPFHRPLDAWSHWLANDGTALTCVYNGLDGYGFVEGHLAKAAEFPEPTIMEKDLPQGQVRKAN